MSTQKAIIVASPKAPFTIADTPVPKPEKGDVLVKVHSVGLNPMDPLRRVMDILVPSYPAIFGSDIAGVIEEVGEGVEGWKKGDEILAGDEGGGYRAYTTIPAELLMRKPSNVSFDDAATFPLTFTTSAVGLYAPAPTGLGLNPTFSLEKTQVGKTAFVLGAGTSCGQFAIQLLNLIGFTRIIAYASGKHTEYLTSLGATHVIPRTDTSIADLPSYPLFSSGQGEADVVFDALYGGDPETGLTLDVAHALLKPGGKLGTVNPRAELSPAVAATPKSPPVQIVKALGSYVGLDALAHTSRGRGAGGAKSLMAGATPAHTQFGLVYKEKVPKLLEAGVIKPNRVEVLPGGLSGIVAGLDRWFVTGEGGVSGVKLVGHPQE
ncbi:GroES-like protein [Mycena kentingensis (nom. inval.)]|nr:GroES-like protein [Mycena kentingensis (nom. inval.)]